MQTFLMYSLLQDTQWLTTHVPSVIEKKAASVLDMRRTQNKNKHIFLFIHITAFKLSEES